MTIGEATLAGRIDAVVIGASAGGIEALSQLLPALPRGMRAPVFVVLHLPRERPSLLVEIFQPKCALPIREAEDKEPVDAGTVYVAPPDYHLLVDGGPRLSLSADDPVHFSRPSIDVLFESASDLYRDRLLAVLLSGANEDGAAGADRVRRRGGVTIVQDPRSARSSLMPQSALNLFQPTHVLALDAIAAMLGTMDASRASGVPSLPMLRAHTAAKR